MAICLASSQSEHGWRAPLNGLSQGTVKLYFNHTAPLDPLPVCSLILPPMHSKYSGQLVVNSQYRLTVNTPFSQDAVTGILRIKQLVAVYTDPVLHR